MLVCMSKWIKLVTRCFLSPAVLILSTLAIGSTSAEAIDSSVIESPVQVVSINLCTDQLVLLLAEKEQILALSTLSRDAAGSYFHELTHDTKQAAAFAEDFVSLQPDVVVTGPYTSRYTLKLLDELGVRVETLPIANSIDEMLANIQRMGELLGQADRATSTIDALKQKLEKLDARVLLSPGKRPRALVYEANGYTVGEGTLRGEVISRAGWHNVADDMGIEAYGVLGLENLIKLKPQALIESPYASDSYSRGQSLAQHPAIRASGLNPAIIPVPSNQTICAGPWTVDIIEQLVEARETLVNID